MKPSFVVSLLILSLLLVLAKTEGNIIYIKPIFSTQAQSIRPSFLSSNFSLFIAGIRFGKVSLPVQQQQKQHVCDPYLVVLCINFYNKLYPSFMLSYFYGCYVNIKVHFWLQEEQNNLLKRSNTDAEEAVLCKDNECTGSQKKRASKVSRKSNNQLPNIHEDYYGPRRHRPRHH